MLFLIILEDYKKLAIHEWKLSNYFTAIRSGSNFNWEEDYNDEIHRSNLSKADQINDILKNELKDISVSLNESIFFDDDIDNIKLIQQKLPYIKSIYLNGDVGLTLEHISDLI